MASAPWYHGSINSTKGIGSGASENACNRDTAVALRRLVWFDDLRSISFFPGALGAMLLLPDKSAVRSEPRHQARFCGVPLRRALVIEKAETATVEDPLDHGTVRQRSRDRVRCFRSNLPDVPLARLLQLLTEQRSNGASPSTTEAALRDAARRAAADRQPWSKAETAVLLVLADLSAEGWTLDVARDAIWMKPPSESARTGETPAAAKARLRAPREIARQRQLAEPSVSKFIARMHAPRRHGTSKVSIASLIDDGTDLARALSEISGLPSAERAEKLATVVDPVVEIVTSANRCLHTGLYLRDVWRYFRHTWSLEYRPTPGRNLQVIVRNAARPNAPVMGIAALTNPVLNLENRDRWIGWNYEALLARLRTAPQCWPDVRDALVRVLEEAQGEIRCDDLIDTANAFEGEALERNLAALEHAANRERAAALRAREADPDSRASAKTLPRAVDGEVDWAEASATPLFRAKRARALADVLSGLRGLERAPADGVRLLAELKRDAELDRAIRLALRKLRERGLASRILEVNVCGAAAPYRELLGGKLVALALATAEVRDQYRTRYRHSPSEIASKMAGRPLVRENDVCMLTTTSLYGIGSSQYNRLKVDLGGDRVIRWREVGETRGFGTIHFREETVHLLRQMSIAKRGHRHVNNVFGEGTSPLLRQIRDGLSALRFDANDVLEHSWTRLIYAAELYPSARDDLLFDQCTAPALPSMAEVAQAWRDRWLSARIARPDILARVATQGPATLEADLITRPSEPTLFEHMQATDGKELLA
ncbi:Druantia anti-phage system protein DruA [Methylobacterium sp. sgz302541]|uniref:Druantia anti-phage system protein DruA n=1 Tax=unclassified Methylobacterium TaxID=2615210 RepID=UPI003D344F63